MGKKRYVKGLRIHRKHLATSTIKELMVEVQAVHHWEFSPHFASNAKKRNLDITVEFANEIITDGALIEFHTLKRSRRVLLRHMPTGITIVVDLDGKVIVSVWHNEIDDNHFNLNTTQYLFGG